MARLGLGVDRPTPLEQRFVAPGMACTGRDPTDAAVQMLLVVPVHEPAGPQPRLHQISHAVLRELRAVLGRAEHALGVGVVVAHTRAGVRRRHAQPVQHGQHRGGFERGTVVAVQHGFARARGEVFTQRGALEQLGGVLGAVVGVDFPADDLAAEDIQDHVEVEELPLDLAGQVRHVPAPQLLGCAGHVGRGRTRRARSLSASAMLVLAVFAHEAVKAGFTGDVAAFIGQGGHDEGRGPGC